MKKIINVTHNDLDGVGNTIVIKSLYPDRLVESHFCGYHDVERIIDTILNNMGKDVEYVYITDISFRKESGLAKRIDTINKEKRYNCIRLFDHHSTSAYLNKYDWAWSYENDPFTGELKCGTQWTYDMLLGEPISNRNNETLKEFVTLVNLWDTWRWVTDYPDKPNVRASWLNSILLSYGKEKFVEEYCRKILENQPIFNTSELTLIECNEREVELSVHKKNKEMIVTEIKYQTRHRYLDFIKEYLKSNHISDKNYLMNTNYKTTFKVGVVYLERNISSVCNKLAEMHPELDLIVGVNLPNSISLRCVKDLDVPLGILAQYLTGKGGGHPKSAGGVLHSDFATTLVKSIIK